MNAAGAAPGPLVFFLHYVWSGPAYIYTLPCLTDLSLLCSYHILAFFVHRLLIPLFFAVN